MKKSYFLPLLQATCFLLISLCLQSCGGPHNLAIEGEKELVEKTEQIEGQVFTIGANQEQGSNTLLTLMPELWQYIFSYLNFEAVLVVRSVSVDWNELITGFKEVGIRGVENKPCHIIDTRGWVKEKEIDFASDKLKPKTILSFAFYHLMGYVYGLHKKFWPYLQGTNIHTVDLDGSQLGDEGAEGFAKHLQGTCVHTVNLRYNKIWARGAEGFAKHLQGTRVHTVNLRYNHIGDEGAEGFAKHLQGTQVHIVNLEANEIGDQGAEALSKHLQGTQVHTVNLSFNRIGDQGSEEFARLLKGTRVHTIILVGNRISDQGAVGFAKHLKGTCVHTVYLGNNPIGLFTERLLTKQYPHIKWRGFSFF